MQAVEYVEFISLSNRLRNIEKTKVAPGTNWANDLFVSVTNALDYSLHGKYDSELLVFTPCRWVAQCGCILCVGW